MSLLSKAEKSFIQSGLLSTPPIRSDGRSLTDYRTISLETGVAPLANGSARVSIGRDGKEGGNGTEVIAATKLEVEDISKGEGVEGGRIVVNVSCSPTAYPHHTTSQLEDLQHDLSTLLHQTLSHPSLHPSNLSILPSKKSWLLSLDCLVLSDSGNILDTLFIASTSALYDTKVPRTRSVEYKAPKRSFTSTSTSTATNTRSESNAITSNSAAQNDMDIDQDIQSGFDTRTLKLASDFELPDYWDEGEILSGRESWPVGVTLNVEPPTHYLDASTTEQLSTPLQLLLVFSFPPSPSPTPNSPPNSPSPKPKPKLQATRMLGAGELTFTQLKELIKAGEGYAKDLHTSLHAKLKQEDLRRNQKARQRFESRR